MITKKDAARRIENCWCRYRDKEMFKLLKYALSIADRSLTYEIMRKIKPAEAELFKDPAFKAIIRFRFAGEEFPPYIVFKVFIKTDGHGIKYLTGKKVIRPASKAAVDSCNIMGNRKFFDQIISDLCEENQNEITDEFDVTCLKDYMKYLSTLDEMSARTGGKANTWRKLSLEVLPRHHVIYDVVTYLLEGIKTERFLQYLHSKGCLPPTQQQQVEYIHMLTNRNGEKACEPSRGSKQARKRVEKMKKLYQSPEKDFNDSEKTRNTPNNNNDEIEHSSNHFIQSRDQMSSRDHNRQQICDEIDFNEISWDEEGKLLFEWTQNLSMDNMLSR